METFFKTHKYLVEHLDLPIRRKVLNEINPDSRLVGIKGSRGVGKTSFLLQYAKDHFAPDSKECLYINLNNFYFACKAISDFANEFRMKGGKVLLIDQVFKYPDWAKELRYCYDNYPDLKIIFTTSSVSQLHADNSHLADVVDSYNLRGFSFREFINLTVGTNLDSYNLEQIIQNHEEIAKEICSTIKPIAYLEDYLHYGFYPFFLEKRNFSENLLKTMNMMLEVDVLSIMQIEQSYLPKLRKLLYLLAISTPGSPNISQLSNDIETSRATVMNYIKCLQDARLVNMLYPTDEEFPKKPSVLYMQNPNLLYSVRTFRSDENALIETFFYNQVHKDYTINVGRKGAQFLVDRKYNFIVEKGINNKEVQGVHYATCGIDIGKGCRIPLWLFGFLY